MIEWLLGTRSATTLTTSLAEWEVSWVELFENSFEEFEVVELDCWTTGECPVSRVPYDVFPEWIEFVEVVDGRYTTKG